MMALGVFVVSGGDHSDDVAVGAGGPCNRNVPKGEARQTYGGVTLAIRASLTRPPKCKKIDQKNPS